MFIRRTRTRADGEYFTFRLVRSERIGDKVRQRTLLNLGRDFDVAQGDWPTLCRRIDEILAGRLPLSPDIPPEMEAHAQRITAALLAGDRVGATSPPSDRDHDLRQVDVDSLEPLRPRSVGVEHVGLWAMGQLALPDLLERLGIGPSLRAAAVGLIIARMACPGSEHVTRRWLGEHSALGELLGTDFETMGPMRLDRASDALMAHRGAIERHLFDRAMGLFGLQRTVTLYDLTDTCFEGGAGLQPEARRGHSMDKCADRPLPAFGLVLDAGGFVCRSQMFAGNVGGHRTLAGMLDALGAPPGALVVMDRGIATGERVRWLHGQGYRYLVVGRKRARHFDAENSMRIRTAADRDVRLHKVVSDDGREARLYCVSEERAAKERAIVERSAERFEQALTELSEGLAKPRARKRIERVWERIGRLKARSRGLARYYDITVDTDPTGRHAVAVRFSRRPSSGPMVTHPDMYCLRTNRTDWDEATLWRTHMTLTGIGEVFRSLKSEHGPRPVHRRKSIRAEGHPFITVIAYQLVQVIRTRLREAGRHDSWATLRPILEGQQRITATFRLDDGRTLHVRKATRAEASQMAVYDALGIDHAPGGTRKTIV